MGAGPKIYSAARNILHGAKTPLAQRALELKRLMWEQ
jgi:hypothetical protein